MLQEAEQALVILGPSGQSVHRLPFETLAAPDWGYVYERHVGLHYEALGYEVEYRGLRESFRDGGIDLVANRDGTVPIFVQCKYNREKTIGRQDMENILYKADLYLRKVVPNPCPRRSACFVLAVPSIPESFAAKRQKNKDRVFYPVADHFLAQNRRQL